VVILAELLLGEPRMDEICDANIMSCKALLDKISLTE